MNDNTSSFLENSQYSEDGYLGLIHIDKFVPRPLLNYPYGSYQENIYYSGVFVGTSYRIKFCTSSYEELLNYKKDHIEEFCTCVRIVVGSL